MIKASCNFLKRRKHSRFVKSCLRPSSDELLLLYRRRGSARESEWRGCRLLRKQRMLASTRSAKMSEEKTELSTS